MAGIWPALAPVGKTIVSKEIAPSALERNAQAEVAHFRGH
jgi:hypothetical protein